MSFIVHKKLTDLTVLYTAPLRQRLDHFIKNTINKDDRSKDHKN
ncbi:hypothetical protein MTBBW1_2500027 [Desulfamplus magnetovallimortis]|uniref:Uncharacterized protein n=1 Tax=Desulfamplus magnetovallimortis TaxID=1246637 RepID=A0A1W1HER0_9BACT|nr:hypothetical protein MTBBW1_2500027 [Desulfamplus magnetovallimortis]